MNEVIQTPEIAKIVGCSNNQARYNIQNNVWTFGRVKKSKGRKYCWSTINEVSKYLGISREEAISRLKGGDADETGNCPCKQ